MSLSSLIAMTERLKDMSPEERVEMHAKANERLQVFNRECEIRIRNKVPSQALLNKVCDWGSKYDL